jgi:leader peptidase (prepilin peptidase)/N-methyltransferase
VILALVSACGLAGVAVATPLSSVIDREVAARTRVAAGGGPVGVGAPACSPVNTTLVGGLTGASFAALAWRFGWSAELPAYLVLAGFLVVLSLIDLATKTLPRRIVYTAGWLGVAALVPVSAVGGEPERILWGAAGAAGSLVAYWLLHSAVRGGLGFGDVRLGAVLGWFLGWQAVRLPLSAMFFAFLLSAVVGIALVLLGRTGRRSALPFGPFMAVAAVGCLLVS